MFAHTATKFVAGCESILDLMVETEKLLGTEMFTSSNLHLHGKQN